MFGFVGGGNMASAIISGLIASGTSPSEIIVSDKNSNTLAHLKSLHSVCTTELNAEAASRCDILFMCVKPNILQCVADEIKDVISDNTVIVSIAAGKNLAALEKMFGSAKKIVRVMPNTPALVGEAMSAACSNKNAESVIDTIVDIFNKMGKCEKVSEQLFDTVTAVSGSSPAYVFMMIEAMADGAVQGGMSRELAYKFAAQAVLGSAKMVLETGKHPGELKDMVCSPGGTTIDAVASLENNGFRNAIIDAMNACRNKSKIM
ncbi:MAG: pyrroline-5-carboxylate reductase [Clostridia bacterium]|nr:pyrroline-5-carboxylate reductase [Clostridia bacterium]